MLSVAAAAQFPAGEGSEVAFAGRSNAGKSSAINAITERKALVRTSKTPGQTRLLNYFELEPGHRIVDLPGYGYAAVRPQERAQWIPLLEALRGRAALRGQHAQYTLKQLTDYANEQRYRDVNSGEPTRSRNGHMMTNIAKRLTQQDMEALASYIQGLR